ncbi:MAG: RNA polymerase sigma factor [Ekhidna sp.]
MQLVNTQDLIKKCQSQNKKAQEELYGRLSIPMMGVCLRYLKNREDAEEVLLSGFFKVFKNLEKFTYENEIAFFAWVKRIMINESLMLLRKNKQIQILAINEDLDFEDELSSLNELETADILKTIQQIPLGYRTVFNLYEVEGYSHREISKTLDISVGTSKSQLFKAKKMLRELLESEHDGYGT